MIIVKFKGGLGNQMFQFALYKWFENRNCDVRADLHFYDDKPHMYCLRNIYGVEVKNALDKDIEKYGDFSFDIISRVRRKLWGNKKSYIIENTTQFYDFSGIDNIYLDGYWQNQRYFAEIRKDIYNTYHVNPRFDQYQESLYEQIHREKAASIHIRRGDYLKGDNARHYGGICTDKYYANAILYLMTWHEVDTFYVFSDDFEWANSKFQSNSSIRYVVVKTSGDNDLFLMAACQYNIIANSSYSWWAAWLNSNENKVTIAPSRWLNTEEVKGIYCKEWILIEP